MKDGYDSINALAITKSKYGLHCMRVHNDEANALNSAGSVQINERSQAKTKSTICLAANAQFNAIWTSEEGDLWVVDDHGDVFTSAAVSFTKPAYKNIEYNSGLYAIDWQVTEVFFGQLNGIWGTTNHDVWVTSFAGPAFHWNGLEWQQHELPQAPNAIDGSASDDVYVVGYEGNIHHWDGVTWSKIKLPEDVNIKDSLTDVCVVNRECVYITARSGALLKGNARAGFKNVGTDQYSWYGVGHMQDRIFLAGGELGIFEYIDEQFVCLKDKGHPVGVYSLDDTIAFIPGEQQSNSWFVLYAPDEPRDWNKITTSN